MREIKFRAWDKKSNKVRQVKSIAFESCGISYVGDSPVNVINMWGIDCIENKAIIVHRDIKHVELMQYTGLKDKNGTEIYEGDIIKNTVGYLEKVVFGNGSFKTSSIKHPNANLYLLDTYNDYIEVIGNIYEDKNLLEVE